MAESVLRIVIDSRNAERNARNIANELQNIERNGDHASRSMDSMSVATRSLVGYMGGLVTIGAAISKMDAYTGLQNRLKLVTDSQVELNTAMNDTFGIAQKTASSWDSVAMVYQRFADNADRLNITMAQTSALTETVSKAISVSGGSAASAEAALMQFGQALASGVLRGEEFNSIAEQAPGLLKAIAFGLNTNVGSLRAMAQDGKITGDVLVDALGKAKPYIDDLFNRTDFTISQSFTKLSNEVTKFVGEAGKGSGAASALSDSIGLLANNLSLIADIAVVGGVALLTKTILTQTVAIYGSITASVARRSTLLAELAVQAAASTAEVARTGAIAQFTAMQLVDAKATAARMTGIQRLAYVQATVIPLEAKATQMTAAHTTATAADTVVQNANNAARSRGAMLLRMIGGPIGLITLGVAGLAAGYMLMRDNTNKATAAIDIQGQSVDDLIVKYRELNTLQRDNETKALADQVEDLSLKFRVASSDLTSFMQALPVSDDKITTWSKLHSEFSQGRINSVQYYESIKALNILNDDQLNKVRGLIGGYDSSNTKMKEAEVAQKALAAAAKKTTQEAKDQAISVADLSEKIKELLKSSSQNITDSSITSALASRGYNDTMIDLAKKYLAVEDAIVENAQGQRVLRDDLKKMLKAEYDAIMKAKGAVDSRNEAEKERTKELEKQQKVLQASSKVQANAAKYNFGGLESKYSLPNGMLSALHAIETGNTGKTNQVNKQSGATGGFQFLKGTADQYGVKDRTDMAQSAEGAAKYMSYLLKLFKGDLEKAVRAYHAGEGNVQKGKNIGKYNNDYWQKFKGYTAGENGFTGGDVGAKEWEKQLEEATRLLEEQAELRKNLEFNIASEVTRIRSKLSDDLQEIDKAGYSPEKAKELKAEYQARADNDIAIANHALKTKLDDYAAFKNTESELLKDSFDERKFYAARDLELTKDQRDKAVALLESQYQQELGYIKLAQETRLFQMREALMSETVAMQERYRLEREQILLNSKLTEEQKQREIELSKALQQEEVRNRLNNAVQNWGQTQADMNGTGEQFQIEQTRFSRYDQSQDVFDAEMSNTDQKAQDPNANLEEIAAEREAIWQAHSDRMIEIDTAANQARLDLNLSNGEAIAGSMADMFKTMQGEQSGAYKAMFAIEKAMAIARSVMAIQTGIAQASALPFPANLGAMATVAAQTMSIVSNIKAVADTGFKSGGYTGNYGVNQEAGVVHGQEYVLNAAATKRVGVGTLDAINSGKSLGGNVVVQPQITINVPQGFTAEKSEDSSGAVTIDIVRKEINQGVKRGFSNLNNPNSFEAKQIQRNTTAGVKR